MLDSIISTIILLIFFMCVAYFIIKELEIDKFIKKLMRRIR